MKKDNEGTEIWIKFTDGEEIYLKGRYLRELETENYKYYERGYDKKVYHIKKEHIKYVFGGTEEDIIESRKIKTQEDM